VREAPAARPRAAPMKKLLRRALALLAATAVLAAGAAALLVYALWGDLERTVIEKFTGRRWEIPSRIYSDAFVVFPGIDVTAAGLVERLQRLNYREVAASVARRGDFARTERGFEILLREFTYPQSGAAAAAGAAASRLEQPPVGPIRLVLDGNTVARIEDVQSGQELFSLRVEPEVITGLYDTVWEERQVVELETVPPLLVRTILATEDRRFYRHRGVDPIGILRAMLINLTRGRLVQGGSTLTQQLMKNFFLSEERTLRRKLQEMVMAVITERRFGKDEILEAYLNEIYLGQSGVQSIHGIWEASQFYFARPLQELSPAECALLAGMIRAPNHYSPYTHPETARRRRDVILQLMHEEAIIDEPTYRAALAEPLRSAPLHKRGNAAPYFVDYLRAELEQDYPPAALTSEGLRIFTSLDTQMQRFAEQAVSEGLEQLEKAHPRLKDGGGPLEAALLAIRPQTGEIKAMVGGRSYRTTQFNRAVQARRQPGSVFKPIVYLAAFEKAADDGEPLGPTSVLEDAPFEWRYEGRSWSPQNYRDKYAGEVTVRDALEMSLNAATARLAFSTGIEPIRDLAARMGLAGPLPPYPSMVLGALEASPLEIAQAYSVLANQGLRSVPRATRKVVDRNSEPIERRPVEVEQVVDAAAAYMVTHLMQGVLDHGTGTDARRLGFRRPAAGKTGTTNDEKDAWFAGFTPDLLTVVWVGFDDNRPLRLTGAQAALPIWTRFMNAATAALPASNFVPPPGVALVTIDPYTGGIATAACPDRLVEAFWRGHEPTEPCTVHPAEPDSEHPFPEEPSDEE